MKPVGTNQKKALEALKKLEARQKIEIKKYGYICTY